MTVHYLAQFPGRDLACGLVMATGRQWSGVLSMVTCPGCQATILADGSVEPEAAAALARDHAAGLHHDALSVDDCTHCNPPGVPMSTTPTTEPGVVAHFYLSELKHNAYDKDAATVTFQVVGRGEQNKTWAAATPTGQLTMTVKNPAAAAVFERGHLGDEYEVTIRRLPGRTP